MLRTVNCGLELLHPGHILEKPSVRVLWTGISDSCNVRAVVLYDGPRSFLYAEMGEEREETITSQSYCNIEEMVPGAHFHLHLHSKILKYFLYAYRLHMTAHR